MEKKDSLNTGITAVLGLSFFAISLFWQIYDYVIPLLLSNYTQNELLINSVMMLDNLFALFLLPLFGKLSDRTKSRLGKRMPYILPGTILAGITFALIPVSQIFGRIEIIIVTISVCLCCMAVFRTPASALMPDITPRHLRSRGEAVINVMGTIGAILAALVLIPIFNPDKKIDGRFVISPWLFITCGIIMIVSVIIMAIFIRENKLAEKSKQPETEPGLHHMSTASVAELSKRKRRSLILILITVFLVFMSYNALTTNLSRLSNKLWGAPAFAALAVLLISSFISFIPAGLLSSKSGRKKTVMLGLALMSAGYLPLIYVEIKAVIYICFALQGVGYAMITVNALPMVVELSRGSDIGRYTGFYYSFNMAAQCVTPLLSGALIEYVGFSALFPYLTLFTVLAIFSMHLVEFGEAPSVFADKMSLLGLLDTKK